MWGGGFFVIDKKSALTFISYFGVDEEILKID